MHGQGHGGVEGVIRVTSIASRLRCSVAVRDAPAAASEVASGVGTEVAETPEISEILGRFDPRFDLAEEREPPEGGGAAPPCPPPCPLPWGLSFGGGAPAPAAVVAAAAAPAPAVPAAVVAAAAAVTGAVRRGSLCGLCVRSHSATALADGGGRTCASTRLAIPLRPPPAPPPAPAPEFGRGGTVGRGGRLWHLLQPPPSCRMCCRLARQLNSQSDWVSFATKRNSRFMRTTDPPALVGRSLRCPKKGGGLSTLAPVLSSSVSQIESADGGAVARRQTRLPSLRCGTRAPPA